MTEAQEVEEAPIATEDTRGQDPLGGHVARQHIPQSEEDQNRGPGPDPRLGGGRGLRGQCRDQDRRVFVKIRIWRILRIRESEI